MAAPFELTTKAELVGGLAPLSHLFWIKARLNPPTSSNNVVVAADHWLAAGFNEGATSRWYRCQAEPKLRAALASLVDASRQIPEYMGVGVEVAAETGVGSTVARGQ
jgi:hypothetical protein